MRSAGCEACLGSDFEVHPASAVCGRRLRRCRRCGLVEDVSGPGPLSTMGAPDGPPPRDARVDHRRAAVVMRLLPEGRVLEVDCEEGNFLSALDSRRYSVVGVERDESKAGVAKEMLRCSGIQGMVINTDLRGAALEPERFDLVALFGCLGRAGSPRALLMDVVRILKGGGTVAIETPVLSSLTARVMGGRWPPLKDRRNRFFFTQECLEKLLVSCGFQPGETRTTVPGGWPSPGNVFHVARKSAATLKAKGADDLARAVRGVSEDPAIGVVR